tara:strand:- start:348 stop:560 length:213 start_codon:yes stop_codon:yes gene_type:complete
MLGTKIINTHGLGQKAMNVSKKVGKVALNSAKVLGGAVATIGAIGALTGFDNPGVKMVHTRGGLERTIRG